MSDESPSAGGLDERALDDLLHAAWQAEPCGGEPSADTTVFDPQRYRDIKTIGIGGMGVVFLARDTQLHRPVALKVVGPRAHLGDVEADSITPLDIRPPPADSDEAASYGELKNRFLQEAWLTAALEHPGVVPVYEVGETGRGIPYYTMRYVRGVRTLEAALDQAQSVEDRHELIEPLMLVCDALKYAHSRGVIHRDIKPANIGLGEFGEVMVLDWGLAKMRDDPDVLDSLWHERIRDFRQALDMRTMAKALGTPGYMSPEAALGDLHRIDERSDVYSLGAVLYRILTGRLPFEFESYSELVHKLREERPALASAIEPSVSQNLAEICANALSFAKEDRYAGAGQLADAVRRHQRESRVRSEVRTLLQQAGTAIDAAEALEGDACLRQLDRAKVLCHRVLARRRNHVRARTFLAAIGQIRKRTDEKLAAAILAEAEEERRAALERERNRHERERDGQQRRVMRAAVAVLVAIVIGAGVAAWIFNGQRREAQSAERRNWGLLQELGVTEGDRDAAKEQVQALLDSRGQAQKELERWRGEAQTASREASRARQDLTTSDELIRRLQREREKEKARLASGTAQADQEDPRLRVLQKELAGVREQLGGIEDKLRSAEEQAEAMKAELKTKDTELDGRAAELKTAKKRIADLEKNANVPEPPSKGEKYVADMARVPGPAATAHLRTYVLEYEDKTRDRAIEALGVRGGLAARGALPARDSEAAVDVLLDCLEHFQGQWRTQTRILGGLEKAGDARAVDRILRYVRRLGRVSNTGFRGALYLTLGRLRSKAALHYMLDDLSQLNEPGGAGMAVQAMEGLRELTGLPFEQPSTWLQWGRHARKGWKPTSLDLPQSGREFRDDGWRLRIERPKDPRWVFSRTKNTVVRASDAHAPGPKEAGWVEIEAASASEANPRGDGENRRVYEQRRLEAAAGTARQKIPEPLRSGEDATFDRRAVLGGVAGLRHAADGPADGAWQVYLVVHHDLLYTLIVHHGPEASEQTRAGLKQIVKSLRFLDK